MKEVRLIIEECTKNYSRFYCFKSLEDLNAQLLIDGKASINRYPFTFLLNSLTENKISFWQKEVDFSLYLCTSTLAKYTDKQRDEHSFEPILQPLYKNICKELNKHTGIVNTYIDDITLTKIYYNSVNQIGITEVIDTLKLDFKKVKFWL